MNFRKKAYSPFQKPVVFQSSICPNEIFFDWKNVQKRLRKCSPSARSSEIRASCKLAHVMHLFLSLYQFSTLTKTSREHLSTLQLTFLDKHFDLFARNLLWPASITLFLKFFFSKVNLKFAEFFAGVFRNLKNSNRRSKRTFVGKRKYGSGKFLLVDKEKRTRRSLSESSSSVASEMSSHTSVAR